MLKNSFLSYTNLTNGSSPGKHEPRQTGTNVKHAGHLEHPSHYACILHFTIPSKC